MAQFDVYSNPDPSTRDSVPYLVELQSDLLDPMATRVVAPLLSIQSAGTPVRYLMPVFEVEGLSCVMSTAELAGISKSQLGPRVGSLTQERDQIIAALDLLFTGI